MTAYRERMLAGEYDATKTTTKKTTTAKPKRTRTRRTTQSSRKT